MNSETWIKPELVPYDDYRTETGWRWLLDDDAHAWFYVAGRYYFLFPEMSPFRFGLCYGEDSITGNFPRWKFKSIDEFLNEPMFEGKSILEHLPDILGWDP